MRKALVIGIVVGLIFASLGSTAAVAKKKKKKAAPVKVERTIDFDYVCPCTGLFQLGTLTGGDPNLGGGPAQPGAEEAYLKITVEDASGQAVLVNVDQDTNGDGFNDAVADVCATGEPPAEAAAINPGLEMRLFIAAGTCPDGTPSVPLGGTLHLTLSNLP